MRSAMTVFADPASSRQMSAQLVASVTPGFEADEGPLRAVNSPALRGTPAQQLVDGYADAGPEAVGSCDRRTTASRCPPNVMKN